MSWLAAIAIFLLLIVLWLMLNITISFVFVRLGKEAREIVDYYMTRKKQVIAELEADAERMSKGFSSHN